MTQQDLQDIVVIDPIIQLVYGDTGDHTFTLSDILLPGDADAIVERMATSDVHDTELKARVERHMDLAEGALSRHVVFRPKVGRILISEEPTFGRIYTIARSGDEVLRVLAWATEGIAHGTRYRGLSYEDGVNDTIMWLIGDSNDAPDAE